MARRALLVAVGMVLLAGCSQIPTSGPVIAGDEVEPAERQQPFIEVDAADPQDGASPEAIVGGFLQAMASYAPGYETARMFLTEQASQSWDTSAGITVHAGARPTIEAINDTLVSVRMTVSGRVDADGGFVAVQPAVAQEIPLRVEREDGQWRVANPPAGIVISDFDFGLDYEPYNVYYFEPGLDVLVPDPVYLPTDETTPTLLAQRLLAGPSPWLSPAVHTAFPDGTTLAVDAVPVEQGTATVELSAAVAQTGPEDRELMTAQLVWTLGLLPEIERVEVMSDTVPLLQEEPITLRDSRMDRYDPAVLVSDIPLYAVTEQGLSWVAQGAATPVRGPLGRTPGIADVAVSLSGNRAAVVTGGGRLLQVASFGDGEVATVATGANLASPAWDRTGLIWVVDHGAPGHGLIAMTAEGERVDVVAPQLDGHDVERVAVSLDSARIAIVSDGEVLVGDIVRDASQDAVRVEQLRHVGPDGQAIDIAWSAPDSVTALLAVGDDAPATYVMELSGGWTTPRGATVDDLVQVAAAPGRPTIAVRSDGTLFELRPGNRWTEIGAATSPTYPG